MISFSKNKFFIFRIAVSLFFVGLLYFLVRNDIVKAVDAIKNIKINYFLFAVFFFIIQIFFISMRLKFVFDVQNLFFKYKDIVYLNFMGFFFNNFLPTSIGGDIAKIYYTSKRSGKRLVSGFSILADRIFGLLSISIVVLFIIIFFRQEKFQQFIQLLSIFIVLAAIFISFICSSSLLKLISKLLLKFNKKFLIENLSSVHNLIKTYSKNKKILFKIVFVSILGQFFGIIAVYMIARGFTADITLSLVFITVPFIFIASMFPSINGLGVRESAFVFFLKDFIGVDNGLAVAITYLIVMLLMSFTGGIFFLLNKGYPNVKLNEEKVC